ncbi:MAG: acyl-CoA thioesterase II [Propionibacterium sp.]|nr:acyl-CoA thioesterase II [Propionibacterium sp.]
MPANLDQLLNLLDLEEIEVGLFRGHQPVTKMQRAFGGQVLGQALVAGSRTVGDDRHLHSLHAYFLLPGRTDIPMIYDTEITRDGRSFSTRRVVARQGGRVIFTASMSFHVHEEGLDHADPGRLEVPPPEDCPPLSEAMGRSAERDEEWKREFGVLEVRYIGSNRESAAPSNAPHPAGQRFWVRVPGMPDGPHLHEAALAYLSDLTLLSAATVPHSLTIGQRSLAAASLDHTMWFHRPFNAGEWLLYDQISPSASRGVGLSFGMLFQEGRLVASVAQEGLLRLTNKQPPSRDD